MNYFFKKQNLVIGLCLTVLYIPVAVYSQNKASLTGEKKKEAPEQRNIIAGTVEILELTFQPGGVDIGDPKILKVQPIPGSTKLYIFPQEKGSTNILIRDLNNNVAKIINYNVRTTDLSERVRQMRQLLDNVEGITITSVGEKIIIDGDLIVPKDLDRIINVANAFGGAKGGILNLVGLSRVSKRESARRIQDEINRNPWGVNITVRLANNTLFLEGTVSNGISKAKAEDIARTYVPEIISSQSVADGILQTVKKQAIRNLITITQRPPPPAPKMVRVTFHFVEIGKEYAKTALFKWAPTLSTDAGLNFGQSETGGIGASSGGTFSGTIRDLFPKLQSGKNGGYSRVLHSAVAIGISGSLISLDRQDSVPYISGVQDGVPITSLINIGLSISLKPTVKGKDMLELKDTEFNFSAPSGASGAGAPRTTRTSLKNSILIRSGDSAVLGGLISNNMAIDVDKDPGGSGGGGNPILTLLRSRAFRTNKTQFLVFLTPKIIQDAAKGTADIKRKIIGSKRRSKRRYR